MKDELISVVVPSYNCAPWLPRCLDSILNQTYQNLEIIVVNDGSTDDTKAVLDRYISDSSRIRVIHQENSGECSARLVGVAAAEGTWIGFMDADDEAEPQMYEMLIHNAQKYNVDISHCGYAVYRPNGTIDYQHNTGMVKIQDTQTGLRDLLEEKVMEMSLCSKLFKKSLFSGISDWMDFSIVINGDMMMNYYLFSRAEKSVLEDLCPYHYLLRPGSLSRCRLNRHLIYDPISVRQHILDRCAPEMREDARRAVARMCLVSYRKLVMEQGDEFLEDRKQIRKLIRQQQPYCSIIPARNALLIHMIGYTPWLFDCLYPLAERILRK